MVTISSPAITQHTQAIKEKSNVDKIFKAYLSFPNLESYDNQKQTLHLRVHARSRHFNNFITDILT